VFEHPITCLALDDLGRFFFAGAEEKAVYRVDTFKSAQGPTGLSNMQWESTASAIHVTTSGSSNRASTLRTGTEVKTIALSLDSLSLLVGTTNSVNIYDVSSQQLLRSLSIRSGAFPVHISTMVRPPDLVGGSSLGFSAGHTNLQDLYPPITIPAFNRSYDAKRHEIHEVSIIPVAKSPPANPSVYERDEFLRDQLSFRQISDPSAPDSAEPLLRDKITVLESEVQHLRKQLASAKGTNDVLWDTVVHKLSAGGS